MYCLTAISACAAALLSITAVDSTFTPLFRRTKRLNRFEKLNRALLAKSSFVNRKLLVPLPALAVRVTKSALDITPNPTPVPQTQNDTFKNKFKNAVVDVARDPTGRMIFSPATHSHPGPADSRNACSKLMENLARANGLTPYFISSDKGTAKNVDFLGCNENYMLCDATRPVTHDRIPSKHAGTDSTRYAIITTDVLNYTPDLEKILAMGHVVMAYTSNYPTASGSDAAMGISWCQTFKYKGREMNSNWTFEPPTLSERFLAKFGGHSAQTRAAIRACDSIEVWTDTYCNGSGQRPYSERMWDYTGDKYSARSAEGNLVIGQIERRSCPLNPNKMVTLFCPETIFTASAETEYYYHDFSMRNEWNKIRRVPVTILAGVSGAIYSLSHYGKVGSGLISVSKIGGEPLSIIVKSDDLMAMSLKLIGKTIGPQTLNYLVQKDYANGGVTRSPKDQTIYSASLCDIYKLPHNLTLIRTTKFPEVHAPAPFACTKDFQNLIDKYRPPAMPETTGTPEAPSPPQLVTASNTELPVSPESKATPATPMPLGPIARPKQSGLTRTRRTDLPGVAILENINVTPLRTPDDRVKGKRHTPKNQGHRKSLIPN